MMGKRLIKYTFDNSENRDALDKEEMGIFIDDEYRYVGDGKKLRKEVRGCRLGV